MICDALPLLVACAHYIDNSLIGFSVCKQKITLLNGGEELSKTRVSLSFLWRVVQKTS